MLGADVGIDAEHAVWSEWLSLYLDHCRHELSRAQLSELATALRRGVNNTAALSSLVSEPTASKARGLVDFLVSAEESSLRAELLQDAIDRLERAARTRT
jgi:hypothetical protein